MTADIIFSMPWNCGESDCTAPGHWHKASYWFYDDRESPPSYSVDEFSDGDHEDVDEADLPSPEAQIAAWREYYRHVAATGEDPLAEFMVKTVTRRHERWQFRLNGSIIGPVLITDRHAGRLYAGRELPEHVRRYLNLDKAGRKLQDFANWAALAEAVPEVKPLRWLTAHIDHDTPRPAARVSAELRRLARKALRSPASAPEPAPATSAPAGQENAS